VFRRRFQLLSIIASPIYGGKNQSTMSWDFEINTIANNDMINEAIEILCKLYIDDLRINHEQKVLQDL
jgi:hypothetical protein